MNPFRSAAILRAALALAVGSASLAVGMPASARVAPTTAAVTAVSAGPAATTGAERTETAAEADEIVVGLHLSGSPIAPGGILTLTASVTNRSGETLPAGRLVLASGRTPITTTATYDAWIDPGDAAATLTTDHEVAGVDVTEIAPGTTFTTDSIPVSVDTLDLPGTYGVYPVQASYTADTNAAVATSTVVFTATPAPSTVGVAVAVPITVPASANGLIPADLLETYTGPSGVLTRQLDGVRDRPVALAIDPRIIASIRALGAAAPASAVTWLERLQSASNETFPLQYGDADPAAEAQMGFDALRQPTSLLYGLTPSNFSGMTQTPVPAATEPGTSGTGEPFDEASGTPTPEPEPTAGAVPDLAQLLDFPYSDNGILWPSENRVTGGDLALFGASGGTETVVMSTNTALGNTQTASASARVGEAKLLVTDAEASAELREATITAVTADQQQDALNNLSSRLAVLASNADADGRVVLLTLDRSVPANAFRVGEAIGSLQSLPGTRVGTLDDARAQPAAETTIVDPTEPDDRLAPLSDRWGNEPRLDEFATVLDQPELLSGRERAELLALTAVGWRDTPDTFAAALDKHREQTSRTLQSVQLATTTQITMISGQASLPFAVRNDLPYPISVRLDASASNPRLDVGGTVTKSVPANSRETVSVPVEARLGNGDVTVRLQLFSATGVRVASDAFVPVVVRADWEGIGAIVLGSFVALLFVGGLVRTILKRRGERRSATADQTAPPLPHDGGTRPDAEGRND